MGFAHPEPGWIWAQTFSPAKEQLEPYKSSSHSGRRHIRVNPSALKLILLYVVSAKAVQSFNSENARLRLLTSPDSRRANLTYLSPSSSVQWTIFNFNMFKPSIECCGRCPIFDHLSLRIHPMSTVSLQDMVENRARFLSGFSGCMVFDHIFQKRARLSTTFCVGLPEMAE